MGKPKRCARCGGWCEAVGGLVVCVPRKHLKDVGLELHHKDGNPRNNDPANLEIRRNATDLAKGLRYLAQANSQGAGHGPGESGTSLLHEAADYIEQQETNLRIAREQWNAWAHRAHEAEEV